MPSPASGQNNYYASHHRRPSQQSHSSSDHDEAQSIQIQSPTGSLTYLPAMTYTQPGLGKARKLSGSSGGGIPAHAPLSSTTREQTNEFDNVSVDPHDFYRQGQSEPHGFTTDAREQGLESGNGLKQNTIRGQTRRRTSSNSQFWPPALFEASKSTPALSGAMGSRKPSIKDLVAKFDSSNGDNIPPVPSRPGSRLTSRTVSPTITNVAASLDAHSLSAHMDKNFRNGIEESHPISRAIAS
jgi:hypothetical protein